MGPDPPYGAGPEKLPEQGRATASFDGAGLVEGGVHTSFVFDEVKGGDNSVVCVEMGDNLEV